MEGYVKKHIEAGLATIEFFHPAQNSMPGHLLLNMKQAIEEAGNDKGVRLILLKSSGERSFCAGASFTELASIDDLEISHKFFLGFAGVINAIRRCGKIVIGRIHGKAVGGGVGLAAACDYAIATTHAAARLSELAVGIGPFVIGPAVERKVGFSAFSKMALTPDEWQSAEWAHQKGLYSNVFDNTEDMDTYIETLIAKMLTYHPAALTDLKRIFWEGTENWDDLLNERAAISGQLLLSDFSRTAIAGFLGRG
ncbi:MAG: enoyl-CoA hydratase/isomerase family protein [Saprospiraceae bacterium]|nr:enoyl-CoA hydratase/isomerase family protein [Saprospiraceae bacterium]